MSLLIQYLQNTDAFKANRGLRNHPWVKALNSQLAM